MTDTNKLKMKIAESGLRKSYLAEACGISPAAFSQRIAGRTRFQVSEIGTLARLLRLNKTEMNAIFFSGAVENIST